MGEAAIAAIEEVSENNWIAGTMCEVLCEFNLKVPFIRQHPVSYQFMLAVSYLVPTMTCRLEFVPYNISLASQIL